MTVAGLPSLYLKEEKGRDILEADQLFMLKVR